MLKNIVVKDSLKMAFISSGDGSSPSTLKHLRFLHNKLNSLPNYSRGMKQLFSISLIVCMAQGAFAQNKLTPIDKSPMDLAYFPVNYPILRVQNKVADPLYAKVTYSRPQKNGRRVLGELVEFGQVWRFGANEATEIELFKDAQVAGNKIKKGKYSLYALPDHDSWTIIFNKDTDTWGAFQYDDKKDVLRVSVKQEKNSEIAEAFTIMWEKNNDGGANLVFAWDDFKCVVPFVF
jgi:hypothetical protein